ncbi:MAG: hypothetical protein R6U94_13210, partial [Nitriliruptoraceae bacterium]
MTEQFSTSPTNHITAIARDAEVAMQARRAIDAAAMGGVTVEVLEVGGLVSQELSDPRQEPLRDETPHLEHLADALEGGAHVMTVGLPDPDGV